MTASGHRWQKFVPARPLVALCAMLFAFTPLTAQEGSVGGVVVSEGTGQPLAGAQVSVEGTNRGTITAADGRFLIPGLSGDQVTLSVTMLGFRTATQQANVGNMGLRIVMEETAVALDEIVVTGVPGAQEKRSIGNVVSTINAEELTEKAPVSTLSQMINGRAPGVTVISTTGMLGGGSRVRIRGANSFSLGGEPLIYIDGIRVNNDQSTGPVNQAFGSRSISRWNDLNPEDIESIEIIKGPAAATLYGTEASNGVIQVITKKGRIGEPRFNLTVKQGSVWFDDPEGRLWTNFFDVGDDGTVESIDLVELEQSRGRSIWQTGHLQEYDLSVSGGAELVRYYLGGTFENSTGIERDNQVRNWSGRANISLTPSERWDVSANASYINGRVNLPLEAGGGGATWSTYFARPDRLLDEHRGFWSGTPEAYDDLWESWQDLERTTVGLTLNHRPIDWFSHRLTAGQDQTREQNNELMHNDPRYTFFFSGADEGYKATLDRNVTYSTVDYSGTVTLPVSSDLESSTSFGGQYYRRYVEAVAAYGENFPVPGLTSIDATTENQSTGESSFENVTLGAFVQEQIAWQNRLFLTAAVRADDNSAFGENFDLVYYPKVSGAWVLSEAPFWSVPYINTLRLRAAYGESGQQPDVFAAIRTFTPVTGPNDIGTVTPDNLGNPDLGPERGQEFELGFDAGFLDDRVGVEFTYYDQTTTDAILLREIPPSSGFAGEQYVNAGEISNSGIELLVRGTPWQTADHGVDLTFSLATNENQVVSLGDVTDENFISAGSYLRHQIGYPVGSWFSPRVVSADLVNGVATNLMCDDGQGGALPCDDPDVPSVFLGRTLPDLEGAFSSTITLFNNFRLYGQVDFKRGFSKLDGNYRVRCFFFSECRENWFPEEFDPVLIAEVQDGGTYADAMIDEASYAKLRELSIAYILPTEWAGMLGASGGSISLAGRNLHTWTDYMGLEPESSFNGGSRGGNHSLWEQNVLPQLATFMATINLSF